MSPPPPVPDSLLAVAPFHGNTGPRCVSTDCGLCHWSQPRATRVWQARPVVLRVPQPGWPPGLQVAQGGCRTPSAEPRTGLSRHTASPAGIWNVPPAEEGSGTWRQVFLHCCLCLLSLIQHALLPSYCGQQRSPPWLPLALSTERLPLASVIAQCVTPNCRFIVALHTSADQSEALGSDHPGRTFRGSDVLWFL